MGPNPAVADVRRAVRECLTGIGSGGLVLAACSGGADSLALAAGLAFAAPRDGLRAGAITVDHGLQPGSRERAERVVAMLAALGLDPVECAGVRVGRSGGPEAAARAARYAALTEAAGRYGAAAVLLGHTLDDQAETVLLGLARGSGARSLAGMPERAGLYRRPLLAIRRSATAAACQALGLQPWDDPHNRDPAFTRARVRHEALPSLERALGPGVAVALARTAGQLRADDEALAQWAARETERLGGAVGGAAGGAEPGATAGTGLDCAALGGLPRAVRTRVLRNAAVAAGCPAGALGERHVRQLDLLVTGWHGQRWIDLPAGIRAARRCGKLLFTDGPP